ncbi:MAG: hypothetical protein II720_01430, partial [Bacteroidales bacterium]|nr:hypothetical protein [Bacteroidales bacterium]
QAERFAFEQITTNAEMSSKQMTRFCHLDDQCKDTLETIINRLGLSARAFSRVVKLARTIADLETVASAATTPSPIRPHHLLEAAGYRFLDRRDVLELGK